MRDVRQPLLQVGVRRSDDRQRRMTGLQSRRGLDLPRDSDERILRWQIRVRRRKQRRPLDVGVVVRAAGGQTDPCHAQILQHGEQPVAVVDIACRCPTGVRPNAQRYPSPGASGSPTSDDPIRNGTMSNADSRTPTRRAGASVLMPSTIERRNRSAVLEARRHSGPADRGRSAARARDSHDSASRPRTRTRCAPRRAPRARTRRPARRARRR